MNNNNAPKKRKTGVYVDINKVIDTYNEKNPDLKQLNQKGLAEKISVSPITLGNLKGGNGPVILKQIITMSEMSGLDVKDFITIQSE